MNILKKMDAKNSTKADSKATKNVTFGVFTNYGK